LPIQELKAVWRASLVRDSGSAAPARQAEEHGRYGNPSTAANKQYSMDLIKYMGSVGRAPSSTSLAAR
jgi:hypothetical protein